MKLEWGWMSTLEEPERHAVWYYLRRPWDFEYVALVVIVPMFSLRLGLPGYLHIDDYIRLAAARVAIIDCALLLAAACCAVIGGRAWERSPLPRAMLRARVSGGTVARMLPHAGLETFGGIVLFIGLYDVLEFFYILFDHGGYDSKWQGIGFKGASIATLAALPVLLLFCLWHLQTIRLVYWSRAKSALSIESTLRKSVTTIVVAAVHGAFVVSFAGALEFLALTRRSIQQSDPDWEGLQHLSLLVAVLLAVCLAGAALIQERLIRRWQREARERLNRAVDGGVDEALR